MIAHRKRVALAYPKGEALVVRVEVGILVLWKWLRSKYEAAKLDLAIKQASPNLEGTFVRRVLEYVLTARGVALHVDRILRFLLFDQGQQVGIVCLEHGIEDIGGL